MPVFQLPLSGVPLQHTEPRQSPQTKPKILRPHPPELNPKPELTFCSPELLLVPLHLMSSYFHKHRKTSNNVISISQAHSLSSLGNG